MYVRSNVLLDDRCNIIAQFLSSLQGTLNPNQFQLTGGDLASRFVVNPGSLETALMTGKHTPEYWHCTLFWLRVRAAQTHRSSRTMFACGKRAKVCSMSRRLQLVANDAHSSAVGFLRPSAP